MPTPQNHSDENLVEQCLSGSSAAWLEFYSRFERLVRLVVRRRLGMYQDQCEDMVQEVFITLMSALATFEPRFKLQVFVCSIAERVCIDRYRFERAEKRSAILEPLDDPDHVDIIQANLSAQAKSQEELLSEHERNKILKLALRSLKSSCRELLTLRYLEELSYGEITRRIGGTENTLAVQVSRCIAQLRSTLSAFHEVKAPK